MDDLDLTDKDISHFTDTDQVTDYVKLNVTYTDQDGTEHTGDIIIQLYSEVAPITVENFQNLVSKKFYDGLTFHRIINNRMIQGGDPLGNGYGGNTDENGNRINITGEFSENGITNNLSHIRGVVSMARSDPYDSASSQFFIVHQTNAATAAWDGSYAAFGYVVYGIEHVDGIAAVRTNSSDAPINPVTINTASFVEYNG
ncbi:MAG: peptidylprolyl isomerase [Clostridia bacterium]|nr:peptidylprolyl isomerase [Clostridia bacterium]